MKCLNHFSSIGAVLPPVAGWGELGDDFRETASLNGMPGLDALKNMLYFHVFSEPSAARHLAHFYVYDQEHTAVYSVEQMEAGLTST